MRGNSHVRFLGEGSAARRSPYPTYDEGSIPFTRSSFARRQTDAVRGCTMVQRRSSNVRRLARQPMTSPIQDTYFFLYDQPAYRRIDLCGYAIE